MPAPPALVSQAPPARATPSPGAHPGGNAPPRTAHSASQEGPQARASQSQSCGCSPSPPPCLHRQAQAMGGRRAGMLGSQRAHQTARTSSIMRFWPLARRIDKGPQLLRLLQRQHVGPPRPRTQAACKGLGEHMQRPGRCACLPGGSMKVPAPYCSIRIIFWCGRMPCLQQRSGEVQSCRSAAPSTLRAAAGRAQQGTRQRGAGHLRAAFRRPLQPLHPLQAPACTHRLEMGTTCPPACKPCRHPARSLEGIELPEHGGAGNQQVGARGHAPLVG